MSDDDDAKEIIPAKKELKKKEEPHLVGHTADGKHQVFAPIKGEGPKKVSHLKGNAWVCDACRTTVHRRDAMVDPDTAKVYHKGSCFASRPQEPERTPLPGPEDVEQLAPPSELHLPAPKDEVGVDVVQETDVNVIEGINHATVADNIERNENTRSVAIHLARAVNGLQVAREELKHAMYMADGIDDKHVAPWAKRIIEKADSRLDAMMDNLDMLRFAFDSDGGKQ